MNDLTNLVRNIIRSQCQITQRSKDTALLTITLDRMIAFPSSTTKRLQKFLGITPHPEAKKNRVDLKDLPLIVMDRVDAGSTLVNAVAPPVPTSTVTELFNRIVEEEVLASQEGSCRPISSLIDNGMTNLATKLR